MYLKTTMRLCGQSAMISDHNDVPCGRQLRKKSLPTFKQKPETATSSAVNQLNMCSCTAWRDRAVQCQTAQTHAQDHVSKWYTAVLHETDSPSMAAITTGRLLYKYIPLLLNCCRC